MYLLYCIVHKLISNCLAAPKDWAATCSSAQQNDLEATEIKKTDLILISSEPDFSVKMQKCTY